ncbi:DNA adenine methylase [Streptomyces sp. NPDC059567]|uniref:DNA adenine methylase n=1 Tax=Streptomyces sp. NPDC059567 TaxID=3346867 RepID=UPI0036B5BB4A
MTLASLDTPHTPWKTEGPRTVVQAFPYQGSKRILAGQILSLFPDGKLERLVEPFAGSAAISMAARHYDIADHVSISDVNAPLMGLWRMIANEPDELIASYVHMWHEQQEDPRSYYLEAREKFNRTQQPDLLLYLLCRCVKAAVRYSKTGAFNQGADHRRLGARPKVMSERILAASKLMKTAEIVTGSYEDPLVNANAEDLVYMDPPYQGTSDVPDHRYLKGLTRDTFTDSLQKAVDNDVSFIVSYDVVTADNKYGFALPDELGLTHRHIVAGVSSQATLQGKKKTTVESLYLSPALVRRLGGAEELDRRMGQTAWHQDSLV